MTMTTTHAWGRIAEKSDDSAPAMHGSFLKIHG